MTSGLPADALARIGALWIADQYVPGRDKPESVVQVRLLADWLISGPEPDDAEHCDAEDLHEKIAELIQQRDGHLSTITRQAEEIQTLDRVLNEYAARIHQLEQQLSDRDAAMASTRKYLREGIPKPAPWTPKTGDRVTVTECGLGSAPHVGQVGTIVSSEDGAWRVRISATEVCSAVSVEPAPPETAEPAGRPGDGTP